MKDYLNYMFDFGDNEVTKIIRGNPCISNRLFFLSSGFIATYELKEDTLQREFRISNPR